MLLFALSLAACGQATAPEYVRLDGIAPRLADAPGSTVLVSFWATWCPPCRRETDELVALAGAPPAGLRLLVASQDSDMQAVERFLRGPPNPGLHLRLDLGQRLYNAFGVRTLPTSILVVDGQLVARFDGAREWNSAPVRRLLERLIAEVRRARPGAV